MIPRILRLAGLLMVVVLIGCSETAPLDPGPTTEPAIQASPTDTPPTSPEPTPLPPTMSLPTPSPSPVPIAYITTPCPVTLANGSTPPLESPEPSHHGNGELWTRLWDNGTVRFVPGGPGDIFVTGRLVMGFEWWWSVAGTLTIDGRRLDPGPPRIRARISGNYGDSGFQPVSISFPTEGCWEITGSVGDASLTFVTLVERVDEEAAPIAPAESIAGVPMLGWDEDQGSYVLRPVDPSTGHPLPDRSPIGAGGRSWFPWYNAFSEDGRDFASIESRGEWKCWEYGIDNSFCGASEALIHLVDLVDWTEVTAPLPVNGRAVLFAYSPDSTRVALSYLQRSDDGQQQINTLLIFDSATGEVLVQTNLPFSPSLLEYARDGSELIAYGAPEGAVVHVSKPDSPQLLLLDATTLQINWERRFPDLVSGRWCILNCEQQLQFREYEAWNPAVVLSEDRSSLYIVHAADDRITTVDLDARSVQGIEIWVARSWMERLLDLTAGVVEAKGWAEGATKAAALSPDGARLYVLTHETNGLIGARPKSRGLRVIDIETGREIATLDTEAEEVRLTPDGTRLLLDSRDGSSTTLEVLDAESLDTVVTLGQWRVQLGLDPEGVPIMLATRLLEETTTRFAVLDSETFEVVNSWLGPNRVHWVALWP